MPIRPALLAASGLLLLSGLLRSTAASDARHPVRVATVALARPQTTQTFSGTVQARTLADLAFRVAGKVVERPVEVGDHVHAGELLARLDPADLQLAEQAADAAMQAALADAANARADLARYNQLGRASPAYLASEYDRRLAAGRMASARLLQAERQLSLARDQADYSRLLADADGVITALPVQVGQVVSVGQTVANLAHTDATEVVVDVPENRLADIRTAALVTVGLWAAPDISLRGRVREIGALADPASRTFAVKVSVLEPPAGLLALGMTATVSFASPSAPVAILPATALTDREGHPAVWVFEPAWHRATLRAIDVAGYAADGTMLVRDGLKPGEQVVTAGVDEIEPGMALTAWAGAAR